MDVGAFWLVTFLGVGVAAVSYIIASDRQRFLARFELRQWRENYYLRALPNFLQALHDRHFKTPWPRRPNAVSSAFFRFRIRGLLRKRPRNLRNAFISQHITLFCLLQILQPYLQDFILSERQKIAGKCVAEMEDTHDRDRLLAFIESVRVYREQFHRALTPHDHHVLMAIVERRLVTALRKAHAIFQEHGFSLLGEFSELRRWEQMTGAELAQELPAIPRLHTREHLSARPTQ